MGLCSCTCRWLVGWLVDLAYLGTCLVSVWWWKPYGLAFLTGISCRKKVIPAPQLALLISPLSSSSRSEAFGSLKSSPQHARYLMDLTTVPAPNALTASLSVTQGSPQAVARLMKIYMELTRPPSLTLEDKE